MKDFIRSIVYALYRALGGGQIPQLESVGTIDIYQLSSTLLDKMEAMGQDTAEADLHLADRVSKLYKREDVKTLLSLSEIDKLPFISEDQDCDDFAGMLYGETSKQKAFPGGLVETEKHRLNWFVDENREFWFIEPQNDKMAKDLDTTWQGTRIKYLLS